MTENPSKKVNKPLPSDEPAKRPAAVKPVAEPARNRQRSGLGEEVTDAPDAAAVNPPANATPAKEPPRLLTPLAALWPAATLPEPPKSPETAAKPAAPTTVKVTFALHEPGARQVFLCGEFNGWASDTMPMKRSGDGHWETTVALAPGRYEYKFVVDGNWKHDPLARVNVWNRNGTLNSVAQVRP